MSCAWHADERCMANGTLTLTQRPVGPEQGVLLVGEFCSIHSLMTWCEREGAMSTPKGAMGAKRPGNRQHPEQRPTVTQRRPSRQSFAPRSRT